MSACLGPFPIEYMGSWVNGAGMGGLIPSLMSVAVLGTKVTLQTTQNFFPFKNHFSTIRLTFKNPDSYVSSFAAS